MNIDKIKRILRKFFRQTKHSPKILTYHKIFKTNDNTRKLCVSPEIFSEHIKFLKKHYQIIPLQQMIEHVKNGTLSDKFVSITLDDGYVNNLTNALPILEKNNVPATLFVTAGRIGKQTMHLWEENILNENKNRPMSIEELKLIASSPLIEIGAHTMTHPRLCDLSRSDQEKEIINSKTVLESLIKKPVIAFAYPYGSPNDFDAISMDIAKNNFSYACACTWSVINSDTNIFNLPRIFIQNFNIDKLKEIMTNL